MFEVHGYLSFNLDNILFNLPYDETRYLKTLEVLLMISYHNSPLIPP